MVNEEWVKQFSPKEMAVEFNELAKMVVQLKSIMDEVVNDPKIPEVTKTNYRLKATMVIECYNQKVEHRVARKKL